MKRIILVIALLALLAPGILLAQGELTLEDLFSRQNEMSRKQREIFRRLSALETQVAPTPWSEEFQLGVKVPSASITITRSGNVRNGPGKRHTIVGRTVVGDVYEVTRRQGDWYQIIFNGQEAWIWSGLTDNAKLTVPIVKTPIPTPTHPAGVQTVVIDQTRQSYWAAPTEGTEAGAGKYAVPAGEYVYICTKTGNEYWHKIAVPGAPDGWVWIRGIIYYLDEVYCDQ